LRPFCARSAPPVNRKRPIALRCNEGGKREKVPWARAHYHISSRQRITRPGEASGKGIAIRLDTKGEKTVHLFATVWE
jgi:hypothetical protein